MRHRVLAVPLVLALALLRAPALAADGEPSTAAAASVSGAVRTESGVGVPQLPVRLDGPGGQRTTLTGPSGAYRFEGLPAGTYALSVDVPGFVLSSPPTLPLDEGESRRLDAVLSPAPLREHVVVSATRGEAASSTLGVSTSVIDAERIESRQSSDLAHLLEDAPGVAVARTGGVGRQAALFVRGGESRFARIELDGVPLNEPGGLYSIGTQLPLEMERIEIARGAGSSLYGTDALAGVVEIVTRRARPGEAASLRGEAELGGLGWRRTAAGSSGERGGFDWNAGVQRLDTDNEGPNAEFDSTAAAASVGWAPAAGWSLRAVSRVELSEAGAPGQTAYGRPDLDASYERTDLAAGLVLRRAGARVAHELRLGHARTDQLSLDPVDSGAFVPRWGDVTGEFESFDFVNPDGYRNDVRRLLGGYQVEGQTGAHLLTAGLDLEHEWGTLGDRREEPLEPSRTSAGVFVQARLAFGTRTFVTAGGRIEHNGSFGTEAVPRLAVAVRVRGGVDATTVRASAGLGIKEPGFLESFGISEFALGNPDLEPERSRTVDVGIEQRFLGGRARLDATLFHHDYLDQIGYQIVDFTTFRGSYFNLGRTRATGVELELEAAPADGVHVRAQYSWLDGEIVDSANAFDPVYAEGRSLLRRPAHQGLLGASLERGAVSAGADLRLVGRRADSDFAGLGLSDNPGYARLDARVRVRVSARLDAFVVGENLLDREYQEALGYPALGRAVRAGLRFDTRRRGQAP